MDQKKKKKSNQMKKEGKTNITVFSLKTEVTSLILACL